MDNTVKEVSISVSWTDSIGQYKKDFTSLKALNDFLIKNRRVLEFLRESK
ncbi:hypothetical protein ACFLU5_11400 [Bacteroidota bacterium]